MKKLLILSLAFFFVACANRAPQKPDRIVHVVFIWLKDAGNAKHQKMLIDASRAFARIPGVLDVSVGKALPNERPIVDDSFDVGLFLTFKNEEDLNAYLVHPDHEAAVTAFIKPLSEKVVVYDIVDK